MKNSKKVISAIIISLGLIIASLIYAYAHRYEVDRYLRIDKWTGKIEKMKLMD